MNDESMWLKCLVSATVAVSLSAWFNLYRLASRCLHYYAESKSSSLWKSLILVALLPYSLDFTAPVPGLGH